MKLKLKATIKKVASYTVEGLLTFYTSEDENLDRTFKNAEEVYDYYRDRKNWPEGWDGPEWEDEKIPKNWSVELNDTDDPRWKPSDGYKVEILIYGDIPDYYESDWSSELKWDFVDAQIYRISPHIPEE